MLERPLYAGYITHERWGLHMQPAQHEPLISLETWHKIQNRLSGRTKDDACAPIRADTRPDFPLRGCENRRKNIRKDDIEGDFEALLMGIQPSPKASNAILDMLRDLWDKQLVKANSAVKTAKADIKKLEDKAAQVMERILATTSPMLITAYEKEIQRIEEEKLLLEEKTLKSPENFKTFEEAYPTALEFLANPWKLWASDKIEDRRMLLRLAFTGRLPYHRKHGYPTAKTAIPFKDLANFKTNNSGMVPSAGLEPASPCGLRILSPLCLPISPRGQTEIFF